MARGGDDEKQAREAAEIEERASPAGSIVHAAILKEGEDELERPTRALAWSGLAAGLSMGFSFVTQSLIHAALPASGWRPLLSSAGYSVGFLIVVLGRQQLFTENTLTVILPLLTNRDRGTLLDVVRLWGVVFAANLVGAFLFAWMLVKTNVVEPDVSAAMASLAAQSVATPFATTLLRAVYAGWLIALMVWLLPFAETGRVRVIVIITWVVGLAHFSHVIAGACEAFYVTIAGTVTVGAMLTRFLVPALLGNILGGVSLVAALNHAQVMAGKDDR